MPEKGIRILRRSGYASAVRKTQVNSVLSAVSLNRPDGFVHADMRMPVSSARSAAILSLLHTKKDHGRADPAELPVTEEDSAQSAAARSRSDPERRGL